jgi:hypothetical protein
LFETAFLEFRLRNTTAQQTQIDIN